VTAVQTCAPADVLQGMVFFAFGFNLVDCGGLLGGRLDSGDTKLPAKKVQSPIGSTVDFAFQ
jgi:hypothetical protein